MEKELRFKSQYIVDLIIMIINQIHKWWTAQVSLGMRAWEQSGWDEIPNSNKVITEAETPTGPV